MNNLLHSIVNKAILAAKSRTTLVVLALSWLSTNYQTFQPYLSPQHYAELIALLGFLTIVFHVNPSQNYNQNPTQPNA
jgi:hypothetical protein